MPSGGSNRLLTTRQVAELLGCSYWTVRRHAESSWGLRVARLGRELRFRERDVINLIDRL